jgi:pyruvate/2-oxoglutarate dehydrogenase complex dihydrolipoamide acyltransferase (E2) component
MFALPLIGQEADLTPRAQVGGAAAAVDKAAATEPDESATGTQEPAVAKPAEGNATVPAEGQSTVGPAKLVPVTYSARQIAGELLVDLVQTQVCPDEWADTGNGDGVIQVVGGVLVVSQTEDALNQVGSMLRELESKLAAIDSRSKGDGGQFAK